MERDIPAIVRNFRIAGKISGFSPETTGHINDSFLVSIEGDESKYFLQWVNNYIFKDVAGLMQNIEVVTRHLRTKLNNNQRNSHNRLLQLIPANDGKSFYCDENQEYWRIYRYIPGTHVYNIVENEAIAYEGGKAFGRFISDLADLPANKLSETIPNFHNIETRLATFYQSVKSDPVNRLKEIPLEIGFIEDRVKEMLRIPSMIRSGLLPLRITHNDTKFNNILFNEANKAICIVDLDTVMPGSVLFDFGDAIRTGANSVCEDEKDLSKVDINLNIYKAYTRGFIKETQSSLTSAEIDYLSFSSRFMTFIIGIRFLTDFLDGDPYFRTNYPDHNLIRARVQFRLIQCMEKQAVEMEQIVKEALSKCKSSIN
ncbi:MAG: aminoglycoside phosphotransferase family protein [Bacteroidetes bacterium]|nr:aminoglycoside phosphotransferase family protein [Bacteroidota bacterium]